MLIYFHADDFCFESTPVRKRQLWPIVTIRPAIRDSNQIETGHYIWKVNNSYVFYAENKILLNISVSMNVTMWSESSELWLRRTDVTNIARFELGFYQIRLRKSQIQYTLFGGRLLYLERENLTLSLSLNDISH